MAKLEMDTDFIRKLAAIIEETKLVEIELADGDRRIRVARPAVAAAAPIAAMAPVAVPATAPAAGGLAAAASDVGRHPGAVKSPMVGTAYLSPEPGKPVFVNIGDKVTAGQTLLIIEAMKVMNPIAAPEAGVVEAILISYGQPVEYGEPMLVLR